MLIAVASVITAGALLIDNTMTENRIEKELDSVTTELEENMEQYAEIKEESSAEKDLSWTEENVSVGAKYSKKINEARYIGILYFPSIDNLSIPVIDECTDANLLKSACRYAGSLGKNNMVIAGHNYRRIFGKLASKLNNGSIIYFKSLDGVTNKYKLIKIEDLNPKQVKEMQIGEWDLTLFTCTYDGSLRTAFRFERESF